MNIIFQEMQQFWGRKSPQEYRKFGITTGVALLLGGLLLIYLGSAWSTGILITGAVVGLLGVFLPIVLMPVYVLWMSLAVVLGFIMTRLLLTIIYYLVFAPANLILRLVGKDLLKQKQKANRSTYWIERESKTYQPRDAEKQY